MAELKTTDSYDVHDASKDVLDVLQGNHKQVKQPDNEEGNTPVKTVEQKPADPKDGDVKMSGGAQTQDEPKKDEPKKDEPKKDEQKKDESKKAEPKKDKPKKDGQQKGGAKNTEDDSDGEYEISDALGEITDVITTDLFGFGSGDSKKGHDKSSDKGKSGDKGKDKSGEKSKDKSGDKSKDKSGGKDKGTSDNKGADKSGQQAGGKDGSGEPEPELTAEQRYHKELKDAFNVFDADKSGFIEKKELQNILKDITLTDDDLKDFDKNGDGKLDIDEMVAILSTFIQE